MNATPLYLNDADAIVTASWHGEIDVVRHLLTAGISPDTIDEHGGTALHAAAQEGWEQVAILLIEAKADINKKDKDGNTPLDIAIYHEHTAIVNLLAGLGADRTEGESPISKLWGQIYDAFDTKDAVERLAKRIKENKKNEPGH